MAYHTPKQVEEQLSIKTATLRKYATRLEAVGYEFEKNEHGHRFYRDLDVLALRKLIEIKEKTNMVLDDCAVAVMKWQNGDVDEPEVQVATKWDKPAPTENVIIHEESYAPEVPNQMMETFVKTIERYEAVMNKQQQMLEQVLNTQQEAVGLHEQSKAIHVEQKIAQGVQEGLTREMSEALGRSKDREQMLINQIAGLRKDLTAKQLREEQEIKEESKPKEKNRSFWQRLFSPSN